MLTRIAPTPSGFLHTGNLYNFLINWLWARCNGGRVLLRIDDGDAERKRPEYVEDIFRALDWLGLDWDIGPSGPDDFERIWSQKYREPLYRQTLEELAGNKKLFACGCSRKRKQTDTSTDACSCSQIAFDPNIPGMAWRVKLEGDTQIAFTDRTMGAVQIDLALTTGPFVVRRKDGIPAYQLCSLADDRHFGISHIARGADLLESTAMQCYLDRQLAHPQFEKTVFHHHALLQSKGEKLSKSAGVQGRSIRETERPEQIIGGFFRWMNCNGKAPDNAQSLLSHFSGILLP